MLGCPEQLHLKRLIERAFLTGFEDALPQRLDHPIKLVIIQLTGDGLN